MNPAVVKQQIANLRMSHPELCEDEEAWLLSLESETDLDALLQAIEEKRSEAEGLAGGLAGTIARFQLRQERFERREKACRGLMFTLMQSADLKKMQLPEATLSIANGQPKVIITDPELIPSALCRVKYEADRACIKSRLIEGIAVPGATLSNAEPHLTIRTR